MEKRIFGTLTTILLALAAAPGCGSSRDVTVSGTIANDAPAGATGPIRLEFYEPATGSDAGATASTDLKLVESVTLKSAGPYQESVSMDGNQLYVVAILDSDQSNACSDGESWGETVVTVADDDTAQAMIDISPQSHCLVTSSSE